jgi:hypothetical protein
MGNLLVLIGRPNWTENLAGHLYDEGATANGDRYKPFE